MSETLVVVREPTLGLVVIREPAPELVVTEAPATTLTVAAPGPRGLGGPAGTGDAVRFDSVASVALGGHRVVRPDPDGQVAYASAADPADVIGPLWLTTAAAAALAAVPVLALGAHAEPSWAWVPNLPVYLGVDGLLTQDVPTAPHFLAQVGTALSATSLFFDPRLALVLA